MTWIVVPALEDLRHQLNAVCPDRDKSSDGSVGDQSHAAGRSSHNPDRTGSPEYRDGDKLNEVRARDFDKDLRHPDVSMADVVRHLVTGARAGRFWWLRYVIYQGVIYHKGHEWRAHQYDGANRHDHHAHVNSDFTQAADTVRNVDYHLEELVALSADDKKWITAEIAKVAAQVWSYRLEDPRSTATPKEKKAAGTYVRYVDVIGDRSAETVVKALDPAKIAEQVAAKLAAQPPQA